MNTQHLAGIVVALVVGVAGGYGLRSVTGPHVIMDPACQGQRMAQQAGGVASMDMLAGVDQTNPAAVDAAFISGMVPHHESAIAAARTVIEHGEDSSVKGLAENIIKNQQTEIDWMNTWLGAHGMGPANGTHGDATPPAGSSGMAAVSATSNVMPAAGPSSTTTPSGTVPKAADPNAAGPSGTDVE